MSAPSVPRPPKLLDQLRSALRVRHLSRSTEKAYVQWVRRFILFHNKRHPVEMGKREVEEFLTHLAVQREVSASTQNQALSALLFLYREVLQREFGWLTDVVRCQTCSAYTGRVYACRIDGDSRAVERAPLAVRGPAVWQWHARHGSAANAGEGLGLRAVAGASA